MPNRRNIAGYPICNTTTPAFVRFLNRRLRQKRSTRLIFANANLITRCGHLREAIGRDPDVFVLNDGIALDAACWLKFRSTFRENMNGTDFTPALLAALDRPARVFLVGGAPDVVQKVAYGVDRMPNVRIAGYVDGYSIWSRQDEVVSHIEDAKPDIILVALGNPLQEDWILANGHRFEGCLMIGVGALFNFMAGAQPRAPALLRRLKLEWAHRLALEPRRLLGRYTIGMARFFAMALLRDRQRNAS
jgi:beta-1,4-glucosyltransferase